MVDQLKMKLGRKAIKTDTRTLKMARYLTPELPPAPVAANWSDGIAAFGMMLNDKLGDCTIAGCGHAIQIWTANCYSESSVSDSGILTAYEKWDGYNPADPSTDQGGVELDVLNHWRKEGLYGHHICGFVDPTVSNLEEIKQSIAMFGGVYIGIGLPITAQAQDTWDVVTDPGDGSTVAGSWGGHCVYVCAYDADGLTCITWGALKKMTWGFWNTYVDEAHTILGAGWIKAGKAPSGFNLAQLQMDLNLIK